MGFHIVKRDHCPLWKKCCFYLGAVAFALLLGAAYLFYKKVITWHIPASFIFTAWVYSLFAGGAPAHVQLLTGGIMIGAFFMATDYVTSPMSHRGQLIYGVCIGLLTVVIRNWGAYPEGMSFAIFTMNAFTPLINTYCKPKRFGEVKK